jgi:hypothetical protein
MAFRCTSCGNLTEAIHRCCDVCIEAKVRRTCEAQGLSFEITDPVMIDRLATLLAPGPPVEPLGGGRPRRKALGGNQAV